MSHSESEPWAQQPQEPNKQYERFLLYLRLGPERTLHAAYVQSRLVRVARVPHAEPRSRVGVPKSWKRAFARYDWEVRAAAHDKAERDIVTAEYDRRRQEVLSSGYAIDFERIAKLKELAVLLWDELSADTKRWLRDVKGIGNGDKFERVDIERFNAPLIEQFRSTLDDIAKERGDRKQKVEADVRHHEVTSDQMAEARKRAHEYEQNLANE